MFIEHQITFRLLLLTCNRCNIPYFFLLSIVSDVPSVVILKPSYVAEKGDTITIECNVESNLNVISVYWLHNISGVVKTIYGSETTKYSGSSPLVPSLTVSGVDFTDIGLYTCIAENSIGTGTSASVPLNVIERVRGTIYYLYREKTKVVFSYSSCQFLKEPSWVLSYGSWMYNYIC